MEGWGAQITLFCETNPKYLVDKDLSAGSWSCSGLRRPRMAFAGRRHGPKGAKTARSRHKTAQYSTCSCAEWHRKDPLRPRNEGGQRLPAEAAPSPQRLWRVGDLAQAGLRHPRPPSARDYTDSGPHLVRERDHPLARSRSSFVPRRACVDPATAGLGTGGTSEGRGAPSFAEATEGKRARARGSVSRCPGGGLRLRRSGRWHTRTWWGSSGLSAGCSRCPA